MDLLNAELDDLVIYWLKTNCVQRQAATGKKFDQVPRLSHAESQLKSAQEPDSVLKNNSPAFSSNLNAFVL